jgi:hypothetical protein
MKSRSSSSAAAASTAAVPQTSAGANAQIMNAPEHTGSSPATEKVVEVDLADSKAENYWRDSTVDLFIRLEELCPGDPGELSGALIRVMNGGKFASLNVSIGDTLQPYGDRTAHWLGYLDADELMQFTTQVLTGRIAKARLREFYQETNPYAFSGVELIFLGSDGLIAPQICVQLGTHCLGILRGERVMRFFQCAQHRCAERAA